MRLHRIALALAAALSSAIAAFATIGIPQQMLTGNPSNATADANNRTKYLIQRDQYAMDYNDTTREPNWVAWNLTSGDVGSSGRSPDFFVDTTLPAGFYRVLTTDYSGSGYDRGHMTPSADRTVTRADNDVTFFMSNMVPQTPDNNQGVWASFETYSRTLAAAGNEILIISGPGGFAGSTIASGVAIPGYTWKIAVVVPLGTGTTLERIDANTRVIAIKVPNIAGVRSTPWQNYVTSAAQLQTDTGLVFFSALSSGTAAALRAKVDGQTATGTPTITAQPVAQTAAVAGTATFTVTATSTTSTAFTYQWLKNDETITGNASATTATLTLANVQAADVAAYTVVITNNVGPVTSAGAALVITGLAPAIVTSPVSLTRAAGTPAIFTVTASGSPTLSYQWRKAGTNLTDGANISGSTTSSLTVANVQTADAVAYDVIVTNSVASSAPSAAAILTVTPAAPTITLQPVSSQTVVVASTATLSVAATGTAPFTYQWRKGGINLVNGINAPTGVTVTGANAATLSLTGVATGDSGTYDVVVSNGVGTDVTSTASILTVSTVAPGAQVAYTGGTYTQNFDGLPSTGTVTLTGTAPFDLAITPAAVSSLVGWRIGASAGTPGLLIGTGSATNGATYSFGSTSASDRALGTIASGSVIPRLGVMIVNNTPTTITQFTVTYTGEQWRNGGNASLATQTLPFGYSLNATDLNTGTFTDVPALGFTSPITTATAGALDGNATANRVANLSSTITGISWAPGQTLILRWNDTNDTGNDHGLAIDDFSFNTPVAAPAVTPAIVSTTPTTGAVGVNGTSPITVTFNQAVTVASGWFTLSSAVNGALAATVTGGPTTYTITPPVSFSDNDTVTVTFIASQITESGTGTLHPAANTTLSFATAQPVAPTITTAPVATTVNAGTTATFTVVAGGTAPFSYQWRKAGSNITGNTSATTATLMLPNVQAADAADYDVVISNGVVPAVTSTAVVLTVTPVAPTISTPPAAASILYGNNATFTVTASGTAPFTYQWRKAGVNLANGTALNAATISGATSATLTLTSITSADAGSYDVVITNSVNPTTSAAATLTVTLPDPGPSTTYASGTYTQNFDTLPATGVVSFAGPPALPVPYSFAAAPVNASGMSGWSLAPVSGTVTLRSASGNETNGAAYSYGTTGSSERSLGAQGSGSSVARFAVALKNTSGSTITQVTVGYTGEQWRNGGSSNPNKLTFAYSTDATTIAVGVFHPVTALNFTSPVSSGTSGALDGNATANRTVIPPVTITGLNWIDGATLTLRWTDADDTGADDGLAIDDLTFTAAPNIATAPIAQHVISGGTATFTVATTASPVTYQWRKGGVNITGNTSATTATLTLRSATSASAGSYDCVLTNTFGTTTTTAVNLTVGTQNVAITLANTSATYDGTPKPVTVTTSPAGLPFALSYAGSSSAPTDAGSYVVSSNVSTTEASGSVSTILTIAKATQTVTLGSVPAGITPGIAFSLAATASSGLPITLSVVSGNATVSGNSVTLADTAPVALRATQSGNNNYASASADTTVTAAKLAQAIAFAALADQRSAAGPIVLSAVTSSGLPVTFTLVSGPATLSGNTLTLTGTAGTVTVRAAQAGDATYNAAPVVERAFAVTIANTAPVITAQPAAQTALVGATATFSVTATGTPTPTYQWRKNGTPAGTGATLTLTNVTAADAAGYDVVVTNSVGSVTSSLARLTLNATPTAPVITRQPGNVVALAGRSATFTVVATGAPAPTYQWSKGSAAIAGATSASFTLPGVATADAGTYSVTVTNSAGTASASATLRVIARSYAGTYFGSLGAGGTFALRIGDDNTGVFLAFLPGSSTAFVSRGVAINDNGTFSFTTGSNTTGTAAAGEFFAERTLAAANDTTFSGSISDTGAVSGSTSGANTLALAATKSPDTGTAAASAGFYSAGAAGSSAQTLAIVSPTGQALVVTQNGTTIDGGTGTVSATGQVTVTTAGRATISANVSADAALTATVTTAAGTTTTFTGFSATSAALAQQRIVNLSTRTTAGTGDQVAIVGFVITGLESKPILLRAVGPALRALGVSTALAAPRLDLRSATGALLATNTAWGSAGNSAEIANAAARSGAFPLAAGSADSVILTTLAAGTYSAVISAADAIAGVGLVEVYDLSGGSLAQKLANLSTRAPIGSGEATLISGLVVGGTAPKRVLIRAAGPALTQFGVAGALARPTLTLFSAIGAVLATNTAWITSADSAALADAATQVGAFAFGATSADSALLVNLAPGAYTAQVTGATGTTGITLLEVYELP